MGREAPLLFGGWEVGLLVIMAILYAGGFYLNPAFFGSTDALFSVMRDASRYGVLAIGMTFVIVNKELDLSVGSTFGFFGFGFAEAPPATTAATTHTNTSARFIATPLVERRFNGSLGDRYSVARVAEPASRAFRRRIAFVCSCETRDSVTPSTSPISRRVSSS